MIEGMSVFAIVVVAFIVITVLMGVRQVPQGYNYTVVRFGKYHKTLTPGLGLILPYIDSIGHKLNVIEQVVDVPRRDLVPAQPVDEERPVQLGEVVPRRLIASLRPDQEALPCHRHRATSGTPPTCPRRRPSRARPGDHVGQGRGFKGLGAAPE